MDWNFVYITAGALLNALVLGIWKPWGTAYAGEKGKNFARKEDLNEILAEVRAVTITQKEIEAKLSGDLWDRQMRWNQKRDLYVDLLKFSQDLGQAYGEIPDTLTMRADVRPEFRAEGEKNLLNCLRRIQESQPQFSKAIMLSHIFTTPECFRTLKEFANARTSTELPTAVWATSEGIKFSTLVGTLTAIAKKDLGLEE